jgi:hypothetical protein
LEIDRRFRNRELAFHVQALRCVLDNQVRLGEHARARQVGR